MIVSCHFYDGMDEKEDHGTKADASETFASYGGDATAAITYANLKQMQ